MDRFEENLSVGGALYRVRRTDAAEEMSLPGYLDMIKNRYYNKQKEQDVCQQPSNNQQLNEQTQGSQKVSSPSTTDTQSQTQKPLASSILGAQFVESLRLLEKTITSLEDTLRYTPISTLCLSVVPEQERELASISYRLSCLNLAIQHLQQIKAAKKSS